LNTFLTACTSAAIYLTSSALCYAQDKLDLLNEPAFKSHLASKSILVNLLNTQEGYIAVGERGHIIQWQTAQDWTQYGVPVSVTITDIAKMSNGNLVAVGHDGVILVYQQGEQTWRKVFDGHSLTKLVINSLEQQVEAQTLRLENLPDDADQTDEEYRLEDLQFALEDTVIEQEAGPNKPLLSIVVANNDRLFVTGAYGTLLQSDDFGVTWQFANTKVDNENKFHLNASAKDKNGNLFLVGENAVAAKSSDNGETWERMTLPYRGSFFGIEASPNSNHLVAYGLQGHVALSQDSGENWTLLPKTLSVSFLGGAISEAGTVYLVGHGGVVVTFDINTPTKQNIYKHPSGATFASIMLESDTDLVLAGQLGIKRWTIGN
jgi:photosystem II stability/assembly factor-like uncharacterized protein